jgi:hypothetical protein
LHESEKEKKTPKKQKTPKISDFLTSAKTAINRQTEKQASFMISI